ncbi:MAG: glycolate oxidase subunit GlcF [Rhodospirillales bacterium]|nr:glycolate oxidase subunit GlcF [Rhodospirillales bacterium]
MQTHFTEEQLRNPTLAEADRILRACVHCGFCTATCPTYVLLAEENDSPRGRIYLIKEMLEGGKPAGEAVRRHLDRCLSCLSCMTTCPSGVDYRHLADLARIHIERTAPPRPSRQAMLRAVLAGILPSPGRLRLAMLVGWLVRPFRRLLPSKLRAMLELMPKVFPAAALRPGTRSAEGARRLRVALLPGCVQQVAARSINEATLRLLTRHGVEVVLAEGVGCCGALVHHLGHEGQAMVYAKANIAAWEKARHDGGLDAIVVNASGCGTMVKDYGHLLRHDPHWADRATAISALARDISEVLADLPLNPGKAEEGIVVAYHAACSLQHGQGIRSQPKALLEAAGFTVREPADSHLCCGSAGVYNILQAPLAKELQERKVAALEALGAQVVAGGNLGCLLQIAAATGLPVVHTVELLDWATGGPKPPKWKGAA